jgi:hypothetical protein
MLEKFFPEHFAHTYTSLLALNLRSLGIIFFGDCSGRLEASPQRGSEVRKVLYGPIMLYSGI